MFFTPTQISQVPSYQRGRLKLNEVNEAVDKFNECLIAKYTLMKKEFVRLEKDKKDQVLKYRDQVNAESKVCALVFYLNVCNSTITGSLLPNRRSVSRTTVAVAGGANQ